MYVLQPGFSLHTFNGHSFQVTSLDFHPKKTDLLGSCDGNGEIRYWNVTQLTCMHAIKVSTIVFTTQKFPNGCAQIEIIYLVVQ
jgi:WD40 repeat protein